MASRNKKWFIIEVGASKFHRSAILPNGNPPKSIKGLVHWLGFEKIGLGRIAS